MRPRDATPTRTLRRLALLLLVAGASLLGAAATAAASPSACTNTWTGAGSDSLWSDAANWSGGVPQSTDIVCAGTGATITLDVSPTVAGVELSDVALTPQGSQTLTATSELDLENGGSPDVLGPGLTLVSQGTSAIDPNLDVCLASGDTLTNSGTLALGDGSDLGGAAEGSTCASGTTGGVVTNTGTIISNATSTQATIDSLTSATGSTLSGPGTLPGTGTLAIDSTLSFPSGSNGEVNLAGQLTLDDDGTTMVGANVQVCEYPTTDLVIGPGATVALASGSELGASDGTLHCDDGGGGGQITNLGTISASGQVEIASASFDNAGSVVVGGPSGSLLAIPASSSSYGVDTGSYAIGASTTLELSGTRDIAFGAQSGTTFSGTGSLTVSGGVTDFQADANLSSLSHFTVSPGATVEVDDSLETPAASPAMTAVSGDLDGYGTATVSQSTSLAFAGSQADLGEGIQVVNDGATSVASGAKVCVDSDAMLENAATLSLNANSVLGQSSAEPDCGPGALLNDAGAQLTTSSGTATINTATFDNAGTVTVPSGTLTLDASSQSTDTGTYALTASSSTLSVQDDAQRVLAGTVTGSGKLALSATGGSGASLEITPQASASLSALTVASGTTLQLDAGPSTPVLGSGPPPITVTGTANLNGTVAFDGDAVTAPSTNETLDLLAFGQQAGNPSFPKDDNGWPASISGSNVVAILSPPAPQNTTLPAISGSPVVGDTLTATQGTWSGAPSSITDQWEDCDPTSGDCNPIGGATGTSYAPTANDVGEQLEVAETATNGTGPTTVYSAMTDAVTSLAPLNLAPPDIEGDEGIIGETLTEIPGEWTNNPSVTLQWEQCDITGTICTPLAGATGPTYTTTASEANDTIAVVETATNPYGSAQAGSESTSVLLDLDDDGGIDGDGDGGASSGSGGSSGSTTRGAASVSVSSHVVSGTAVVIDLRCPRHGSCPVTLTLRASEPVPASHGAHAKGKQPRSRAVVVGSEAVTVSSGQHRAVTVSLNRTGTRLLAHDRTLHTVLTATSRSTTLTTSKVTFTKATHASAAHRGTTTTHRAKQPQHTTASHGHH